MGAACSDVNKREDRSLKMRLPSSPRIIRRQVLRHKDDFLVEYSRVDTVGKDPSVTEICSRMTKVSYVCRSVQKSGVLDDVGLDDYFVQLACIDHVHIARFVEAFDFDDHFELVYEKVSPTNIFETEEALREGRPLDEEIAQVYGLQLAQALHTAHKQGAVHGRLSPSSLLNSTDELRSLKICDIGQTFLVRPSRSGKKNMDYEAPEVLWAELRSATTLSQFKDNMKAYVATDMWAVGVILFRMLTGHLPFEGKDEIREKVAVFGKEWDQMPDAREVVQGLLKKNAGIRTPAGKLLQHPWLMLSRERVSRSKMMRVFRNVLSNATESNFKKLALRMISEGLNQETVDIAQKAFRYIDKNGDGNLCLEEIRTAIRRYGDGDDDDETIGDSIFEAIDVDGSGTLNFREFLAVSIGRQEYSNREVLWNAFNRFDQEGQGCFDKEGVVKMVCEVASVPRSEDVDAKVERMAREIGMNSPVDFDMFVSIMLAYPGEEPMHMQTYWNRMCYTVLKVDNHGVRHLPILSKGITKSPTSAQRPRPFR